MAINKVNETDVLNNSSNSISFDYVDIIQGLSCLENQIKESGVCFTNENGIIQNMYRTDSLDETKRTMIKVVSILELGDKEKNKFMKISKILLETFKIMFKDKFLVFLLSGMFCYMSYVGIKEKYYLLPMIYIWAFFRITESKETYMYLKEMIKLYKANKEAISDEDILMIRNDYLNNESSQDIKMYVLEK